MIKVYGISNCDKVRAYLKELKACGKDFEFFDFKKQAPGASLIKSWGESLGGLPVNKRGTTFRKIKEAYEQGTEDEKIALLVSHPSAIKRPLIVEGQGQARFAQAKKA